MKKIFRSNKGFSLLELLIVITISMILVGGAAIGINLLHNANVNSAADRLKSAFNSARSISMAKGQNAGALTFRRVGESVYVYIGDPVYGRGDTVTTSEMELICTGALSAHLNCQIAVGGVDGLGEPDLLDFGGYLDDPTDIIDKTTFVFDPAGQMLLYKESGPAQPLKQMALYEVSFRKGVTGDRIAVMYIRPTTGSTGTAVFVAPTTP